MTFTEKRQQVIASPEGSQEASFCCPPSICCFLEGLFDDQKVALTRGVLVWIIGVSAWAIGSIINVSSEITIESLIPILIVVGLTALFGFIAYGVLNVTGQACLPHVKIYYPIQLGLIVGASFGLVPIAQSIYNIFSSDQASNYQSYLLVVGVLVTLMLAGAYRLGCFDPCGFCPIPCVSALVYAIAALSTGYSLTYIVDFGERIKAINAFESEFSFLFLLALFLAVAIGAIIELSKSGVAQICVPTAIILSVFSVSRALYSILHSESRVPDASLTFVFSPLIPLVFLAGFWSLWSLVRCRKGVVTVSSIINGLVGSVLPFILIFAIPAQSESQAALAFVMVPSLIASAAVLLLSKCVSRCEDCIALLLIVASIGAYAFGLVIAPIAMYEAAAKINGFSFADQFTLPKDSIILLSVGLVLLTIATVRGWPRRQIDCVSAARSFVYSSLGASAAALFGSFAGYSYGTDSSLSISTILTGILIWAPVVIAAVGAASSCTKKEFGALVVASGISLGSISFAKSIGQVLTISLVPPFVNNGIQSLFVLPILLVLIVAFSVVGIYFTLSSKKCGPCPRDVFASFLTALLISAISNYITAILDNAIDAFNEGPLIFANLENALPAYQLVLVLAVASGLIYLASPLFLCDIICCDASAASASFLPFAFINGPLLSVIIGSFGGSYNSPHWPTFAAALLFTLVVLGVISPIVIRLFLNSGSLPVCAPSSFKCTWPQDIICIAIGKILYGEHFAVETFRYINPSLFEESSLVFVVSKYFTTLTFLQNYVGAVSVIIFTLVLALAALNFFLVALNKGSLFAKLIVPTLEKAGFSAPSWNQISGDLSLAVASGLALFSLVYWQLGSNTLISSYITLAPVSISIFGWYLIILAYFALIVLSAVLLRVDNQNRYSNIVGSTISRWFGQK